MGIVLMAGWVTTSKWISIPLTCHAKYLTNEARLVTSYLCIKGMCVMPCQLSTIILTRAFDSNILLSTLYSILHT